MKYATRLLTLVFGMLLLLGCEESAKKETSVEKPAPVGGVAQTPETQPEPQKSGGASDSTTTAATAPAETFARSETPGKESAPRAAAQDQTTDPNATSDIQGNPRVVFDTSMGRFVVELDPAVAPITVENFLRYVDEDFYTGTIFHRVMKGFMIQGGGFTIDGLEKPTHSPIKNESQHSLRNTRGTISMARTAVRDSATAQFFINLVNNPSLDYPSLGGYAAFGRVVEGMEVVDKIAEVPVAGTPLSEAQPLRPVVINSIRRAE